MAKSGKPSVAIAGATGHLGTYIANALLSPVHRSKFDQIYLLSRSGSSTSTSSKLQEWQSKGATIRGYSESDSPSSLAAETLSGADVLVSAIGPAGHAFKKKLLSALPESNIRLYFPSEFGVDHYVHDFKHLEWGEKKAHFELAESLFREDGKVKVCRVFAGMFLEDSIGPWFGFDTKRGRYEIVGSSRAHISFTALGDVGNAVAELAALEPELVPEVVHLAGDTLTAEEIQALMDKHGGGPIEIVELDASAYKQETTKLETQDPAQFLRFLMGEGKIDHRKEGLGNENDLAHPEGSKWEWTGLEKVARDTNGRPWKDFDWPPK